VTPTGKYSIGCSIYIYIHTYSLPPTAPHCSLNSLLLPTAPHCSLLLPTAPHCSLLLPTACMHVSMYVFTPCKGFCNFFYTATLNLKR
jgi:hypothetical protein